MAKLKYILRAGKDNTASIQLIFNYGKNNRLRYSTGLNINHVKNWNEKTQRIKNVNEELYKTFVNLELDKIQNHLNRYYSDLMREGAKINNEVLSDELNILLNKRTKVKDEEKEPAFLELLPFFEWFLKHYKENPLPTTKKPIGKGTHKTYNNTYNILKSFNDEVYKLTYKKITLDFYDDFIKHLTKKNLSTNYIGTQIKILKTILNAAFEKDYHSNMDYNKRYFSKPIENTKAIYLNDNELLKIYNVDLSKEKPYRPNQHVTLTAEKLEGARDLFLIGANTGLRISDYNKLTSKNIILHKGEEYFNVTTQKTGINITIPINPMVKAIIKKRGGNLPDSMPDQYINYAIKYIGKLAGIKDDEEKIITKGGKKIIKPVKKYNLISSHTARRSFCTNAYKSGMPTIDIMAISGHQTEKIFYNYIKVTNFERADKIRKHDFFNQSNLKVI